MRYPTSTSTFCCKSIFARLDRNGFARNPTNLRANYNCSEKKSVFTKGNRHMPPIKPVSAAWQPVPPPARCERDTRKLNRFHAHILTPGFSRAFHAATLNRSLTSIATYRAKALQAAQNDPTILDLVTANVRAIGPEQGLAMARARGSAQLVHWSRLAMYDWRKRGFSRVEIAKAFMCSVGTVASVLQGRGWRYFRTGERRLTPRQTKPPGKWRNEPRQCN